MTSQIQYIHTTKTHNTRAAEAFVPILFAEAGIPRSVVDVGCGTGTWLHVCKESGVGTILGIDGDNVDLNSLHIDRTEFKSFDLTKPLALDQAFELAICLEVAEHLPEASADQLVDTLCRLSDRILFSAAMPEQGGQNHLNEQFFDYWKDKFNQRGYLCRDAFRNTIWNDTRVDAWYRQNMYLVEKVQNTPVTQEPINSYYHPEIYLHKASLYAKVFSAHQATRNGEIHVSQALKILVKSILFSVRKLFNA